MDATARVRELRQKTGETAILLEVSKLIHSTFDIPELLALIIAKSLDLTGGEQGCLLTLHNGEVRFEIGRDSQGRVLTEAEFPLSQTIVQQVMDSGQPLYSLNTSDSELGQKTSIVRLKIRMALCVPLLVQGELMGLIYVTSPKPASEDDLPERKLHVLTALAGQAAVALRQARLHQEIEALYQKLKILDAAKSDFIQIMSHELRTPVALVRGYIDMLAETVKSDGQTKPLIEGVQQGAIRLTNIVNSMLNAAQVGQLNLHCYPYSLKMLVKEVADNWQGAIKDRSLSLEIKCEVGDEDSLLWSVDPDYFRVALNHLLQNAVKFTPDGGQIMIRLRKTNDGLEVEVEDTGVGVKPEHREVIFEKFYRVGDTRLHSTGDTKFMGAGPGLGLYLARGIAEAHGGRLWVESEGEDQGSRFVLRLGQ